MDDVLKILFGANVDEHLRQAGTRLEGSLSDGCSTRKTEKEPRFKLVRGEGFKSAVREIVQEEMDKKKVKG